ncbi:GIDE domain-containing protein [Solicola gregarius]|uniref:RING-type E3 ubiquitin transferase n=1 Tax=Solicola gregarius TaxID=2908642 RepID=A0AA46THR8_9ACTN|nr:GIDE domain-containing protein [Solicola gregarius]UYM05587.1 E3 ubiquitin ligase family protein [Solicola gregarius]
MWVVGVILIGVAGFCGYSVYTSRKSIQRMTSTETVTAKDLVALRAAAVAAGSEGAFSQVVEVKGVVRIGPGGPLSAQLTDTKCAWHRHKVERKYRETYRDNDGDRRTRTKTETMTSHRTQDPFYVEDSTGRVLVRPKVIVDTPKKVLDEFEEPKADQAPKEGGLLATVASMAKDAFDDENTIGFRRREWVLTDGARVYVLGEASDRDGELIVGAPADGAKQLITTRTEDEVSEEHGKQGALFTIGGAVAGVAGVVVLAIALVQAL